MDNLNQVKPDFAKIPYSGFLEDSLRELFSRNVQSICVAARFDDDKVLLGYYNAGLNDKILFAHHIQSDAMFDEIEANADWLCDVLDDCEAGMASGEDEDTDEDTDDEYDDGEE